MPPQTRLSLQTHSQAWVLALLHCCPASMASASVGAFGRTAVCPALRVRRHRTVRGTTTVGRGRRMVFGLLTGLLLSNVGGRSPASWTSRLWRGRHGSVPSKPWRWEHGARTGDKSFPCFGVRWLLTWKELKKGFMRRGVSGDAGRGGDRWLLKFSGEGAKPAFPPAASRRSKKKTHHNSSLYVPRDPVNAPWWCSLLSQTSGPNGAWNTAVCPTAG